MATKSISNPDLLKVILESNQETHYGFNQKWYNSVWQRLAGCGPTVAASLIYYLNHTRGNSDANQSCTTIENCVSLMEEMWGYVTPTMNGVSNTRIFYEGVLRYAASKGLNLQYGLLDLAKDKKTARPGFPEVLSFLEGALDKDVPVAFLNLCNGAEKSLDRWHWVTIVSLEYNEEKVWANILDDGEMMKIDLALWYHTTTKDGGFVYFTVGE